MGERPSTGSEAGSEVCPRCNGEGEETLGDYRVYPCSRCGGLGYIKKTSILDRIFKRDK